MSCGGVRVNSDDPGEPARKQFDATLAEMMKGGFAVIKGPLKSNKGAVVATAVGLAQAEADRDSVIRSSQATQAGQ